MARESWVATKRELLRQVKAQVESLLGENSQVLQPHVEAYSQEFSGGWVAASHPEIIESMLHSRIVLAGDFHAFAQSQRAHLRILRSLPNSVPLVLLLECLLEEDQKSLDDYVAGEISEKTFLQQVRWEETWGFPWDHYRPLVRLAKAKGFQIKAMNSHSNQFDLRSLEERENSAARRVRKLRAELPEHLLFVLFGDLHLAKERFPLALRREFADFSLSLTRIFQNSEELYFQLLDKGLENQIEVMKAADHHTFCVLSSPPWVKWQSYLIFLEQAFDLDLEDEDEDDSMDFTDHVHSMVGVLNADFELRTHSDDLAVYSLRDDLSPIIEQFELPEDEFVIRHFIETERSFILPELGVLYLSRFSINHAASLAGMYIHFQHQDHREINFRIEKHFEAWIWIEALAFFFSKWINHKRKPDSLPDLKSKFAGSEDQEEVGRLAMLISLEQRLKETTGGNSSESVKFSEEKRESLFASSKILGSILGEKLYQAVKIGRLPADRLAQVLRQPLFAASFHKFYYHFVSDLESEMVEVKI